MWISLVPVLGTISKSLGMFLPGLSQISLYLLRKLLVWRWLLVSLSQPPLDLRWSPMGLSRASPGLSHHPLALSRDYLGLSQVYPLFVLHLPGLSQVSSGLTLGLSHKSLMILLFLRVPHSFARIAFACVPQ